MQKNDPLSHSFMMKTASLVGILAGLGYSIGTWGIESVMLANAHGMYPFLKFLVGALACGLIGLLAGWLSRRFINVLANVIIWACAGAAFNKIALYLNFTGMQTMVSWLHPDLAGLINYSIDYGVSTRGTLMLIITVVACGLIGLFTNLIIDGITINVGIRRTVPAMIWSVIFLSIGSLSASLNTDPIRDAVLSVDQSIQFSIEHSGEDLSNQVKSQMGLFGLKKIEPYLNTPYRLLPSSYDKMLMYIQILVKFNDINAICPVINGGMGTCYLVEN